jgi:hypothetical protein
MRPLAPSQIGLAEHLTRRHVVTLPPNTPFEQVFDPVFWANVADQRMRIGDQIEVHDAGVRFFAVLYVRAVVQSRPHAGMKGGVHVHLLHFYEFDAPPDVAKVATHQVKFLGPAQGWCVLRLSDGATVAQNLATREDAESHLANLFGKMIA